MNKFNKYWMNFNSLLIVAGLLALPFLPYARLVPPTPTNVLSYETSKFSTLVASKVFEASMSGKEKTFTDALIVTNATNKSKDFWVVLNEDVKEGVTSELDYNAYFSRNQSNVITLAPGESADVSVYISGKGDFKGTLVALSSL